MLLSWPPVKFAWKTRQAKERRAKSVAKGKGKARTKTEVPVSDSDENWLTDLEDMDGPTPFSTYGDAVRQTWRAHEILTGIVLVPELGPAQAKKWLELVNNFLENQIEEIKKMSGLGEVSSPDSLEKYVEAIQKKAESKDNSDTSIDKNILQMLYVICTLCSLNAEARAERYIEDVTPMAIIDRYRVWRSKTVNQLVDILNNHEKSWKKRYWTEYKGLEEAFDAWFFALVAMDHKSSFHESRLSLSSDSD